jgi:hypothetical protein
VAAERSRALAGLMALPPVTVPARESDDAFVLWVDDQPYVCPWQTRLRSWVALEDLRDTLPDPLLDALVSRTELDRAEHDFARWRAARPEARPQILTQTWEVPLRWFVPFAAHERELLLDDGERRLAYRTPMVEARRRMARALKALRDTFEDGPLIQDSEDLGRWLEEFHPRSHVELDYGGLVWLVPRDELVADCSAADVHEALQALQSGDPQAAGEAYRRLVTRWRAVQAYERAS